MIKNEGGLWEILSYEFEVEVKPSHIENLALTFPQKNW